MYFLPQMCFSCLKSKSDLNVINTEMLTKLLYCIDKTEDFIPSTSNETKMCNDCLNKLNIVFDFKKMCLKNIVEFKEYIDQLEQSFNSGGLTGGNKLIESPDVSSAQYSDEQPGTRFIKKENFDAIYFESKSESEKKVFAEELKLPSQNEEILDDYKVELKGDCRDVDFIVLKHQKVTDEPVDHFELDKQIFVKNETPDEIHLQSCGDRESQYSYEHKLILHKEEILDDVTDQELENQPKKILKYQRSEPNAPENHENTVICLICEETFPNKRKLLRHTHIHNKRHCCEKCQKCFSTRTNLKKHMLRHMEEKPHSCSICGKGFVKIYDLNIHQLSHSNERPFSCSICHKSFKLQKVLKTHMLFHANKRPYSCTVCSKRYIQKNDVKRHMVVHTNERNYSCSICGRSFVWKTCLTRHMSIHSNKH